MKKDLIIVGGFLGAGKTSLLYETAKILTEKGQKVALITNDQASALVDTSFLESVNLPVKEVSGSCFCCNFTGFSEALDYVSDKADVIIAEPVGSCTDLSATIMQPLKDKYTLKYNLMPLTVVADPKKLLAVLNGGDSKAEYIMRIQYTEADIILINKTDMLSETEALQLIAKTQKTFPDSKVLTVSAKNKTGITEWIEAMNQTGKAGKTIAEVDYDRYAEGEAAFGWLNVSYEITETADASRTADWLLHELIRLFEGVNIGHIKFIEQGGGKMYIGNITDGAETPFIKIFDSKTVTRGLTINARTETTPEILYAKVTEAVNNVFYEYGGVKETVKNLLIPGRPNPTYRYSKTIEVQTV
jgi:G3E family GTPase